MKNELVLDNYSVQELQAVEKQEVDGGVAPIIACWAIMCAIDVALIAVYATYDAAGKLTRKAKW